MAIGDYLAVVRRRRWIVVAITLAVTATAVIYSLSQSEKYEASAKALLSRANLATSLSGLPDPQASVEDQTVVQTQADLARVPEIAEAVVKEIPELDMTADEFLASSSVESSVDSEILTFLVENGDPDLAARAASAYAEAYSDYRQEVDTASLQSARSAVRRRLKTLEKNDDTQTMLFQSLERRDSELSTLEALQTSNARVIETADSAVQTAPKTARNAILGLALGLFLGLGVAFLRDALDSRVRTVKEISEHLNTPLLGRIPEPPKHVQAEHQLVTMVEPGGLDAEAFRMLRANLEFAMVDRDVRSIMVTSGRAQEGKSTTAANLALAFARTGKRVILADLDLRRPFVEIFFQQQGRPGVSQVVVGAAELDDVLIDVPILPAEIADQLPELSGSRRESNGNAGDAGSLRLLTSGQIPPNPGELAASKALAVVLKRLEELSDLVIIDTPPILQVGDAMALSPSVDGILVVSQLKLAHRKTLVDLDRQLQSARAECLGFVVAGADFEAQGYGYGYAYGFDQAAAPAASETGAGIR